MYKRSDVIYLYDGSFDGLLCCVFESFEKKETPENIVSYGNYEPTLYSCKNIETDIKKASRVSAGINNRISNDAFLLALDGYYTCCINKEMMVLRFLQLGFSVGAKVMSMLADASVSPLLKAVHTLSGEAHQLKGFVRFSIYGGSLVAVIEPKNFVLPLLVQHFCDRYPNEVFMIYDKTHSAALIYKPRQWAIVPVDNFSPPSADDSEMYFRSLWKMFYDTIAIKERENPKCRMNHMQKRYWSQLTEMNDVDKLLTAPTNSEKLSLQ